ncbi:hypothetical protein BJ912DRAFT_985680 [Pholiota molesta]|nr:hypothetical protein BJ912DRAFT_985680 [Pholiota molesta]
MDMVGHLRLGRKQVFANLGYIDAVFATMLCCVPTLSTRYILTYMLMLLAIHLVLMQC